MDKRLLKKKNESEREYHKRLVFGKLVDKTLSDKDYVELSKYVYNKKYSSDVARRMMYGSKYTLSLEEDLINELNIKIIELEKEKIKFQDQKREFKKIARDWARAEHIHDEILKAINNISPIKQLKVNPIYNNDYNKEGLLVISDWHVGISISNYWNEFNKDILFKRINKLLNKTIEYGKFHKIKKLHVFNIGDLVSGIIHVTTRITNTENIIEQTQLVSETINDLLYKLSQEFEEILFYNTIGNHDRVIANKDESISDENFMYLVSWYLKARLKDVDNIKFMENTYDKEIIVANICNKKVFGVHGNRDKVKDVAQNLSLMLKIIPSMIVMGHTHHHEENEINGIDVVVNSSLSGIDEYAKHLRKTSKPAQKLIIFENSEDWRLCTYNINLY